jgi:hypothetical protein
MLVLIKDITIKSLVSGDKAGRIVLETLYPEDIEILAQLASLTEVKVEFKLKEEA